MKKHGYGTHILKNKLCKIILFLCSLLECFLNCFIFSTLDGHLDAVNSACFSPDSNILITASNNAHFILWATDNFRKIYVQEDAHDLGIQSCDFSGNLEPMPNMNLSDVQTYLLATCGNDSFVKLWDITVPKVSLFSITTIIKCLRPTFFILHHASTLMVLKNLQSQILGPSE